jgi:serine/threonine-protein kinase
VLRPHARGGLGVVSIALDADLNREVALKQIQDRHADDPTSRARFLREAEITGGLEHPGIVPVYALGTDENGRPYYVMRFIKGDSLEAEIARYHASGPSRRDSGERSLGLRKLLRRLLDACNAVEYAHGRGVLHRDLKPSNIMAGRYGETLVVDWGLAKCVGRVDHGAASDEPMLTPSSGSGSSETVAGSAIGTPAYMSPEQAAGELDRLGPASDVYSMGATLYCILTGKPPFGGSSRNEVLDAVRRGEFPPPRKLDPSIPPALEAIGLKAMAREPGDRYASPLALTDDLERWMAGEPVSAHRESLSDRARRWARRHRTAVTSAAAAMVVALVGLTVVLAVQGRANAELRRSYDRERARFDLAMDTINRFHTGVSEDFLLNQKEFETLRTKLLSGAKDAYARLLALLEGQPDRRSRRALATALFELGELTAKVGSRDEAIRVHRQSLLIRQALAAEPRSDAEARAEEGRSLWALGTIKNTTGDLDEALELLGRARTMSEALLERYPGDARFRRDLATSLVGIGNVLIKSGNLTEALTAYQHGRTTLERLISDDPGDTRSRNDLASAHNNSGTAQRELGNLTAALDSYKHALTIREELVADHPEATDFRNDLATTLVNLGTVLRRTSEPAKALESFERAIAIRDALVKEHPNITAIDKDLAYTHLSIGAFLKSTGETARALDSYRKARGILEALARKNPGVTEFQRSLARSYSSIADVVSMDGHSDQALEAYGRAQAVMESLNQKNPSVTEYQQNLGVVYNNTATLLELMGRRSEALAVHERTRAIGEALVRDHPNVPGHRDSLAVTLINIGNLRNNADESAQAILPLEQARTLLQALVASNPEIAGYRSHLAMCCLLLGNAFGSLGKAADAESAYQAAQAMMVVLVERNPTVTVFQDQLALAHYNLGELQLRAGKQAEARDSLERAGKIWKSLMDGGSMDTMFSYLYANTVGKLGSIDIRAGRVARGRSDLRRAVAILEEMNMAEPVLLAGLASFHSILARTTPEPGMTETRREAENDAEYAMRALQRAVAAGYRDLRSLRTDPDLDAIRSRPDFRVLLMDLEFPADPLAR